MSNSAKPSTGIICAYCGAGAPNTNDHIPPKNLFSKPLPEDLLTVPCCERCRRGWSKDDEYFRIALLTSSNLADVPSVQPVIDSIFRSLRRPQARGLARLVETSLVEIEQRTKGGIVAGTVPAFKVQRPRLERVGGRIIRALFFEEFNQPLPTTHVAKASIQQFGLDNLWPSIKEVQFAELRSFAADSFHYTFATVPEDPFSSVWLLDFFDRLPMVGFTLSVIRNRIRHAS
jgi:hypothetical protein